jgi:hypothetical protein
LDADAEKEIVQRQGSQQLSVLAFSVAIDLLSSGSRAKHHWIQRDPSECRKYKWPNVVRKPVTVQASLDRTAYPEKVILLGRTSLLRNCAGFVLELQSKAASRNKKQYAKTTVVIGSCWLVLVSVAHNFALITQRSDSGLLTVEPNSHYWP